MSISSISATEYKVPSTLAAGEYGEYIPKKNYQILGVNTETDNFQAIQSKLGINEIYKGEHTANHLCYINNKQAIEFTISSLGFGYKVTNELNRALKCKELTNDIVNDYGLKVGIKKSTAINLLGKPSETEGLTISYTYWVQEKPSEESLNKLRNTHAIPDSVEIWLDVYSHLRITFKNGVIDSFSVFTTETY